MYTTFTEPEKQRIKWLTGKPIIYYKRDAVMKSKDKIAQVFSFIWGKIKENAKAIVKAFQSWKEKIVANLPRMKPRDRYRAIRVLSKCGFDEREINLAVHMRHLCRDNC